MGAPTVVIGKRTRKNNHNVYILGAGFSSEAGLPTIPNFLNSMRDAADWLAREHRDQERSAVERVLEFRHDASAAGYRVNVDLDNVEDLFSLATAHPDRRLAQDMQTAIAATLNHAQVHASPPSVRLRMRPSESWPITAAWRAAAERISASGDGGEDIFCSIYDYYAALLAGRISRTDNGDQNVILTFNYDLLLETSLARLGIPFSYGLGDEGVEYHESATCASGSQPGTLKLLKLHGSLNWSAANERLRVVGSFDDVMALGETAQVVPPTWDKTVSTSMRHVWGQAVNALTQATRVIVIGFSFRVVDAHFKYLLAAGLMDNSALRRIVVVNPEGSRLARQIRAVLRGDQFKYGVVRLYDQTLHEFALMPERLEELGRPLNHEALSIVELGDVRLSDMGSGRLVNERHRLWR